MPSWDGQDRQNEGPQMNLPELLPVALRPDKVHVARPWGFKGTMVKPDNWNTKEPYKSPAPDHWKFLSLAKSGERYSIVSFARNAPLVSGDLKILGFPDISTQNLSFASAITLGEKMEKAWDKLPKPEKKISRQHNST